MTTSSFFLSGVTMATFAAAGVFFLKFWKVSHDRFFLLFSIACGLISLERVIGLFVDATQQNLWNPAVESGAWIYLIRLSTFIMISFAILEKNRVKSKS